MLYKKIKTIKKLPKLFVQFPVTSTVLLVTFMVYLLPTNKAIEAVSKIRDVPKDYFIQDINLSNLKNEIEVGKNLIKNQSTYLVNTPYPGVENFIQYITEKLNLKPLAGVKPLRPEFGPVLNDVTSYKYPIEIEPCRYVNGSQNLFIAIISGVGNFEKRSIIRQTWMRHLLAEFQSDKNSPVNLSGYGFIVGQSKDQNVTTKIEEESKKYGDILQVGIIDDYYNLTLKAVGFVNWLNNHCSEVDFFQKVDDDVYINVRNLKAFITKTLNRFDETLYGSGVMKRTVFRNGKWNISFEDWPWLTYPVYPRGGNVLFPGIVIKSLLAAAQVIPILPFEDTYLLGLCTEKAGIKLHRAERLFYIGGKLGPCFVYNYIGWPADASNNMNNSYWATEDFYKNVTQCVIVDSQRRNVTVNPFDYLINSN